jgi:hypothetical protein
LKDRWYPNRPVRGLAAAWKWVDYDEDFFEIVKTESFKEFTTYSASSYKESPSVPEIHQPQQG